MAVNVKNALAQRIGQTESTVLQNMADMFGLTVQEGDIVKLPVSRLLTYANHPFRVENHADFEAFALGIRENGVFQPIIVRPAKQAGFYEILAGHKRTAAVKRWGRTTIKAIIVQADDELASRIILKTNFDARRKFYPSEIARSYQLRHDELKKRRRENSTGWNSDDLIYRQLEEEFAVSKSKLYLYLRFNLLAEPLMEVLDLKKLSTKAAAELSYLTKQEQMLVYQQVYVEGDGRINQQQAAVLRRKSQQRELTEETVRQLQKTYMKEPKMDKPVWYPEFQQYQGKFKDKEEMKQAILQFLAAYKRRV